MPLPRIETSDSAMTIAMQKWASSIRLRGGTRANRRSATPPLPRSARYMPLLPHRSCTHRVDTPAERYRDGVNEPTLGGHLAHAAGQSEKATVVPLIHVKREVTGGKDGRHCAAVMT